MNSKEKSLKSKQEGETTAKAALSSRVWSGFKNPRIIRVSRTFGGKDRHSKVCTIRGLRDRRIRLSVPTAIQLYDLQDRLGLNQPSKVIDWLLDVTKLDIDKLPPLQLPPGFGQFGRELFASHDYSEIRSKSKQIQRGQSSETGKWIKTCNDEEDDESQVHRVIRDYNEQLSAQKLSSMASISSLPSLINNGIAYNSHDYSDQPSGLSLAQFGSHGVLQSQLEITHNSLPNPPFLSSSSSPFFICQPSATHAAFFSPFPPYISTPLESSMQMLNPSFPSSSAHHSFSSSLKSFPPNMNLKPENSENGNSSEKNDSRSRC